MLYCIHKAKGDEPQWTTAKRIPTNSPNESLPSWKKMVGLSSPCQEASEYCLPRLKNRYFKYGWVTRLRIKRRLKAVSAEAKNKLVAAISGILGVFTMVMGGIAYFFFQQTWQIVASVAGIALISFALWADNG